MKIIILVVVSYCCAFSSYSQQVSRSLISSAGESTVSKSGVTATWSVGEVFGNTVEHGYYLTEGFQQGALLKEKSNEVNRLEFHETSIPEMVELNVEVYPTIVSESLYFKMSSYDANSLMVRLVSLDGQQLNVSFQAISDNEFKILNVGRIPNGTYFLQIAVDGAWLDAKQFIKQ